MNNDLIRQTIIQQRKALSPAACEAASQRFLTEFKSYYQAPLDRGPLKIGAYLAVKGELDLGPTIEYLQALGHTVYLPIIAGNRLLTFGKTHENTIYQANRFGIDEPVTDQIISASELDLVLAPGVAFDAHNNRLGMGGGFYDTTFAYRKEHDTPTLIGVGYDFQQTENLSVNTWDIPMDAILLSASS